MQIELNSQVSARIKKIVADNANVVTAEVVANMAIYVGLESMEKDFAKALSTYIAMTKQQSADVPSGPVSRAPRQPRQPRQPKEVVNIPLDSTTPPKAATLAGSSLPAGYPAAPKV